MNLILTSIHIEQSPRSVPLAAAMLSASLGQVPIKGLNVEILNLYLQQSPSECADLILKQSPDCVGFSIYVWNRERTLQVAAILQEKKPGIIVLAGGPEVSADKATLDQEDVVDVLLPGEGEEIIVAAMKHLVAGGDPKRIPEIISPSPVADLAALPSPFIDGTLVPSDYSGMLWELSRGCPFMCDFCYESRGAAGVRRFPIDRIRAELQLFVQAGVEQVFVLDPTFNYNREIAKEILQLIAEVAPNIRFFFEVRSEFVDEEMAELFASINCSLQIGLQSANSEVLSNINRTIDPEAFTSSTLLLHEAGVCYGFDLIYGLPGDSLEGFRNSLDFAMRHVPNHIDIFPLAVLPGTRLQENAESFGLEYQAETPYQVLATPQCAAGDMKLAKQCAEACDLFYNVGMAVPWSAMMLDALGMTASAFFGRFAEWRGDRPSEDVVALQTEFVGELLAGQGDEVLVPLACDVIRFFAYTGRPLEKELSLPCEYSPLELIDQLEQGVTDLRELAVLLRREQCIATISRDGEVTSVD